MARTELPWLLLGRKTRPFSLAVSLADLVVAWSLLIERSGPGEVLDRPMPGTLVGAMAALAAVLLWAGFWRRSDRLMQDGLLCSVFVWGSRAGAIAFTTGALDQSVLLSACWVIAAGGAYLLEHTTHDTTTVVRGDDRGKP